MKTQLPLLSIFIAFLILVSSCQKEEGLGFNEAILLSGEINAETHLTNNNLQRDIADYIVTEDVIINGDLYIESGVRIEFEFGTSLTIANNGSIRAKNEGKEEIVFTGREKRAGYWKGIHVNSMHVMNEIDGAIIEYAGGDPIANENFSSAIHCSTGRLYLKNSMIQYTAGYGLVVDGNSELREHKKNTYINNSDGNLMIHPSNLGVLDDSSVFEGESGRNIIITGGMVDQELEIMKLAEGIAYEITGDITFNKNIKILPGVHLIMYPETKIQVEQFAAFTVDGAENDPVLIEGKVTEQPSWRGIVIQSSTVENQFNHLNIKHAGSNKLDPQWLGDAVAAIGLRNNARLSLHNTTFSEYNGCKVFVKSSAELDYDQSVTDADICTK